MLNTPVKSFLTLRSVLENMTAKIICPFKHIDL
jgi:hypothetical protein